MYHAGHIKSWHLIFVHNQFRCVASPPQDHVPRSVQTSHENTDCDSWHTSFHSTRLFIFTRDLSPGIICFSEIDRGNNHENHSKQHHHNGRLPYLRHRVNSENMVVLAAAFAEKEEFKSGPRSGQTVKENYMIVSLYVCPPAVRHADWGFSASKCPLLWKENVKLENERYSNQNCGKSKTR